MPVVGAIAELNAIPPAFVLRIPDTSEEHASILEVHLCLKAGIQAKVVVELLEIDSRKPVARSIVVIQSNSVTAERSVRLTEIGNDSVRVAGLRAQVLELNAVIVVGSNAAIDSGNQVFVVVAGTRSHERADCRIVANVASISTDYRRAALIEELAL